MKSIFTLAFIFFFLSAGLSQTITVDHCFLSDKHELIIQEKTLRDGGRLLLIVTGQPDTIVPYIIKLDVYDDVAWITKMDTNFVTYNPLVLPDQHKVFETPFGEIFFLNIDIITDQATFALYAHSYAILDQGTGSVIYPKTIIDTFDNGYVFQDDYDGVQVLQSTGPGEYVLYASERHLQPDPEGWRTTVTQFIIQDHTNVTVRSMPVHPDVPDYPSAHRVLAFQDDSLLLMTHYNGFDYRPAVRYLDIFNNQGDVIKHFVFDDTLASADYIKSLRVVERLGNGKYVLMLDQLMYDDEDNLNFSGKFLLLDLALDTITLLADIPVNSLDGFLYQRVPDLVTVSEEYIYEEPLREGYAVYNPGAPVYYFFKQNDSTSAVYRVDGDSLRRVNSQMPRLTTWIPYLKLDNGDIVFLFQEYSGEVSNILLKMDPDGQITDTYLPEILPGSTPDYFPLNAGYLSNSQRLLYVGEYDYDVPGLPLQILDLDDFSAGRVFYVPMTDPIANITNAFDDPEGNVYLIAQPYTGVCYPGKQDVVVYKLSGVPTGVLPVQGVSGLIRVFPNPAHDRLNIDLQNLNGEKVQLKIFDLAGRELLSRFINQDRVDLDISALPAGAYVIRAETGQGARTAKVIIAR